jgi:hypothetical protein
MTPPLTDTEAAALREAMAQAMVLKTDGAPTAIVLAFDNRPVILRLLDERDRLREANEALSLIHLEARELVGEADASGSIPKANLDALRALLYRASVRQAVTMPALEGERKS